MIPQFIEVKVETNLKEYLSKFLLDRFIMLKSGYYLYVSDVVVHEKCIQVFSEINVNKDGSITEIVETFKDNSKILVVKNYDSERNVVEQMKKLPDIEI